MGDVDDDGVLDLLVGAGKDHAPEVVVYSGKSQGGKAPFTTELARFPAFAPEARGGVSVAAAQIDGNGADNIIVGSGPGMPSEVRIQPWHRRRERAGALLHVQPLCRRPLGGERQRRLRRFCNGPLQHRDGAGSRRAGHVKVFTFR